MGDSNAIQQRIFIPALDSLRFLFMLVIFFHHYGLYPHGGGFAVSFFFVLSGFSLTLGYRDRVLQPGFNYFSYITKRLIRFYPLHWLVLFYLAFRLGFHSEHFWSKFFANFFLVQSFIPDGKYFFSFNSPSWFLCNTIFYSLLLPFLLKCICSLKAISRIAFAASIVAFYFILLIIVPQEYYHALLYINPIGRLIDFIMGIFIALLFLKIVRKGYIDNTERYRLPFAIAILCMIVAFEISVSDVDSAFFLRRFYWMLWAPFILIVSIWSFNREKEPKNTHLCGGGIVKILRWLGKYSFSFYIIHTLCIGLSRKILGYFNVDNTAIVVLVTIVGTILAAIAIQKLFVDPVTKFSMKLLNRKEV